MPERELFACASCARRPEHIVVRYTLCERARRRPRPTPSTASCSRSAPRSAGSCTGARSRRPRSASRPPSTSCCSRSAATDEPARSDDRRRRRVAPAPPSQRGRVSSTARSPPNLVERRADSEDQRVVRLRLTALGARRLRQLAGLHLAELRRMMPAIGPALFAEHAEDVATNTTREQHEFLGSRRGRHDRRRPGGARGRADGAQLDRHRRARRLVRRSSPARDPRRARARSTTEIDEAVEGQAGGRRVAQQRALRRASRPRCTITASTSR